MAYLVQRSVKYDRLLNVVSRIMGILGFAFGVRRCLKQRGAQKELSDRERQLNKPPSRLEHLRGIAKNLSQHSAVVRL